MTDKVYVDGLRELRRFLNKAGDDIAKDGLKQIHDKVAEPVETTAKAIAPRKSGNLAGSIRRAKGSSTRAVVRAGGARVPYAGPIHWGWPNRRMVWGKLTSVPVPIASQPFLTDALEANQQQVADIYTDELARFIGYLMNKYGLPR